MRCQACDILLSDYESTRKNITTGEYIDLCNKCYSYVKDTIVTIDRPDLEESIDNEEEILDYVSPID